LPASGPEHGVLTTVEAREAILAAMPVFDTVTVPIDESIGRVLRQSVVAERDQPPFDRVMMDGIAIRFDDFADGTRRYPVQSMQAAGDPAQSLEAGQCIEIMTGASLPDGADCIVPVERIEVKEGVAEIESDYDAEKRQFIHARASDHAQGTELLLPGMRVSPMDIAIIASCGLPEVAVADRPSVVVISTGNELVPAGMPIEPQQIRMSNGPAIAAMLKQHGHDNCKHDHLVDDAALLRTRIGSHLDSTDVLVLSGGVSMGHADHVPQVLDELGVRVEFHKISQRPGKPMWFGVGPKGQPVFALPGNPVSALVCCRQYIVPALNSAAGAATNKLEFATLTEDVTIKAKLTCFLPARLVSNAAGQVLAMPVHTNTSGDLASLSGTDGYVELALEQTRFPAGTTVPLHHWFAT
jgi:molybdopterin molybdotransferase